MIEVLFGESEAASMKAAKSKIVAGASDGPVSVWMAGKRKTPERVSSGWVEGTASEVICLGFLLDIGNIKEPAASIYRKELIYSMYAQNQWEQDDETEAELRRTGDVYAEELRRLEQFLDEGETVRIWYSDAPYSRCGLYHLCRILTGHGNEVHVVKLPEYIVGGKVITSYRNWGEAAAEEFAGFLSCEKILSREEMRMYAWLWDELVEDNSPLRAVINGRVLGVPEDFYDFLIWKKLTAQPVKEARLIGDILGNYPVGIGDWWYAKRIEYYIQRGTICVIEDSENKYARQICIGRE